MKAQPLLASHQSADNLYKGLVGSRLYSAQALELVVCILDTLQLLHNDDTVSKIECSGEQVLFIYRSLGGFSR